MNFPPSPAGGIRSVFGTRGIPDLRVGRDGDLATDPTTGKLYAKSAAGWAFKRQGFQRLFIPSSGDDVDIAEQDPIFFGGILSSRGYLLSATNPGPPDYGPTVLTWTWPQLNLMPGYGEPTGSPPSHIIIDQVILQRSTTTRATPQSATGDGPADGFPSEVAYSTMAPDAAWTTLLNQTPAPVVLQGLGLYPTHYPLVAPSLLATYTDTDAPDHIFNYRLIILFHSNLDSKKWEVDWNVVTVKKPYVLTASSQVDGVHLSWV